MWYNSGHMKARLKTTFIAFPVITIATIGIAFLTEKTASLVFGVSLPEQANVQLVRNMAGWNAAFLRLVFMIVVALPAAEEALFRGLLFRLPSKLNAPVFAVLSSVLFSAAHYLTQPFPDSAFLALFFFGLAQCRLYRKTDRMWCVMLNHALFNAANLLLVFVVPR